MQGILELHVFVSGVRLGIFLQPDDQVGNRFRVNGKIAAFGLLITRLGAIDQVSQELFRTFLILGKFPDRRAIGDMGQGCYSHPIPSQQRRLQPDFFCYLRVLFFSRPQETDGVGAASGLARQHGANVAPRPPGELLGASRLPVQGLDILQDLHRKHVLIEKRIALRVQNPGAKGVQDGVQRDIAFQGWAKRQTAGYAQLVAQFFPAAEQAAIVPRPQGHANLTPLVLKEVQGRRSPEIGKGEICIGFEIEC